mgnify:CR=1 FL=1
MKNFTLKIKQLFAAMLMLACIPASAQFKATVEQYANNDHSTVVAEFTLTEVAAALQTDTATLAAALDAWYNYDAESGAEKPADMFFLKSGDNLLADYNTNAPGGFWMTSDYQIIAYGEGAAFYEDIWFDQAEDFFGIYLGQYPNALAAGATLTPTFVLVYGDKQATFDITYIVKPLPDMPETELEIAKLEIIGETEVTVTQYPRSAYTGDKVYVSLAGVAEKLGVEEELFPTMIPNQMYQSYVDLTYGLKVDSLIAITENDGWGRVAMSLEGDTLQEVCSANYGNLSDLKAYYTNAWSFDENNDTLSCTLGQYPGRMVAGDQLYSYVYIVYGNKAFRIKYNLIIEAAPVEDWDNMVKAGGEKIYIEQYPDNNYTKSYFTLNIDSICNLMGCTADDLSFQALDTEGNPSSIGTTNLSDGFWMTKGGIICSWGTNAFFFVEPNTTGDYSALGIAQMPGAAAVGDEGHTLMYLVGTSSYYELDITLAIIGEPEVEVEFESVATRNFTVQQLLNTGYAWSDQTAAIPYEQIDALIGTTEPVLYALNIDSIAEQTGKKYTKSYSCDPNPGFWLTPDGRRTSWGANSTWGISSAYVSNSNAYTINCIQYHSGVATGDVFTGAFYLVNEETGKMITVNINYQIVEEIVDLEVVGEEWINLPISLDDMMVDYDFAKVATALGLESVEALFDGYYAKGMKADGTYSESVDIVNNGVSFNASGAYEEYASYGVLVTEDFTQFLTYSNDDISAPFKLEVTMCFQIDTKSYVIHITLLDETSYAEGIESINADNKVGKIYNLQGQEVAAPAKGIYIMNGKKILVK